MRLFATIILAALLCATAKAQTLKSLMYNTTNGQVVANTGTNVLTFTNTLVFDEDVSGNAFEASFGSNSVRFDSSGVSFGGQAAQLTRTNLGVPLAALTNTSNVTMMRALAGSTNTAHPYSGTFEVVGPMGNYFLVFSNGILQDLQ